MHQYSYFLASSSAQVADMTCKIKIFIDVDAQQFYLFHFLDFLVINVQSSVTICGSDISWIDG